MKVKSKTPPTGRIIRPNYAIGIDPGVDTGYAYWWTGNGGALKLTAVISKAIHEAMFIIRDEVEEGAIVHVRVEDARLRRWFGTTGAERWKGAGSIMRDCTIWEDYLRDLQQQHPNLTFEMVPPAHNKTKLSADAFQKLTGWTGRTNEHARDAAMLIWGRESFYLK